MSNFHILLTLYNMCKTPKFYGINLLRLFLCQVILTDPLLNEQANAKSTVASIDTIQIWGCLYTSCIR